ncbi:MAG TPA: ATP-binding protein [Candidatus Nitrosotenuis sp.]|nr:ATP-binding protein [Candidatus Nitrosotenuis sp.]
MRIRNKLLLGFLIIIAITTPNGIIGFLKVNNTLSQIENDLSNSLEDLKTASRLNNLAANIRYLDEVLTQAARNYAFTEDAKWSNIYFESEPQLDKAIKDAILIGAQEEKTLFESVDMANRRLVALEHASINLVKEGKPEEAIMILEGQEYWENKKLYKNALEKYAQSKGLEYNEIFDVSTTKLDNSINNIKAVLVDAESLLYFGIPVLLAVAIGLSYVIARTISKPIHSLKNATEKITRGDYDVRLETNRDDEIGDLSRRFESMVKSFKSSLETERQLIMAQEKLKSEKLLAIGELAARIAHDLRNPLSVIKNVCQIMKLQNPPTDEKTREYFAKMETSIQRMSHQIDDVLNFIRTTPLKKEIVSIKDVITKSLEDLEIPPTITISFPQNDEKINCDEQKIRTVFANIMLNSIQAMDGYGRISIKIVGHTKFIDVEISDSGPGIQEDELQKIFEPLFTTKQTGTGLGLSTCKNIVEQHGGYISVRNNPTTFTITLPRL